MEPARLDQREVGFVLGVLSSEAHFGGDGRQPQVTLRMHVRHEQLFRRLETAFPGSALYGPYHHGGRAYLQWMSRGPHLRSVLAPLIHGNLDLLDAHVRERFEAMCRTYGLEAAGGPGAPDAPGPPAPQGSRGPETASGRPAASPPNPAGPGAATAT